MRLFLAIALFWIAPILLLGQAPLAKCSIAIQPLNDFDEVRLSELADGLGAAFACPVRVLAAAELPSSAYYPSRQRYRADRLLPFLVSRGPAGARILGLTAVDISVTKGQYPDWGVFGYASLSGPACVVSTFRLGRRALPQHPLRERLLKVSIHELGHAFGLPHCTLSSCVMCEYRGSMSALDKTSLGFCARCKRRLAGIGR